MGSVRAARERTATNTSEDRLPANSVGPSWPLGGNGNNFTPPQQRGPPPQRPPRPKHVPLMLAEPLRQEPITTYSQMQEYNRNPIQPQQARYWEPNYMLSGPLTPATPSSRDSAGSSVGSIPDFPVPTIPTQTPQPIPRRNTNIGPPPTQRRGPSSYYSHTSYVAPIPEEGIETSQHQTASRRAQIVSDDWQDDGPDFSVNRDSTISAPGEHLVEPVGLVRNASMGRQYKPSLTTIRPTGQTLHQQKGHAAPQLTVVDRSHLAAERTVFVESVDSDDEQASLHDGDSMEGTAFLQTPSTDSDTREEALLREKEMPISPNNARQPRLAQRDSRLQYSKAGAEKDDIMNTMPELTPNGFFKPAAFDFREEASGRASITSLTDLLRRATRVRTNLERGRTASRLGLRDFLNASKSDLLKGPKDEPARESLTDMLESFPPPAAVTPPRQSPTREPPVQTTQVNARWPSPFANTSGNPALSPIEQRQFAQQQQQPRSYDRRRTPQGRRCCGLPLWGFVLCIVLLIVLTAAAILIPVFLIVIPNQNRAEATCPMTSPCSNGGYSFSSSTGCQCICARGFTGVQCTQPAPVTSDCAAAPFGPYQEVTVGTKVLPLLTGSSQFSIPLNNTILLADFSSTNLYCGDENNLVTFVNAGSPQKRDLPVVLQAPSPVRRDAAMTTAGLVLDQPTTTATSTAPTATTTLPSASQLGFAQTAILYIFQQTSLNTAQNMHDTLDTAFSDGAWLGPVTVNSNVTVDLRLLKVTAGGTTVGTGA